MTLTCEACHLQFEATRSSAEFCSARCRMRAQRAPVVPLPTNPAGLTGATRAELEAAGRLGSASGAAAMLIAQRLDAPTADTGAAIAALVREHRVTLADAVRGARVADDPVEKLRDELKARRESKRGPA